MLPLKNYDFSLKDTIGNYYSGGKIYNFNFKTEFFLKELSDKMWGDKGRVFLEYVIGKVNAVKKPDCAPNKLWKHYLYDVNSIITQGENLSCNFLKRFSSVGNSKIFIKMLEEGINCHESISDLNEKSSDLSCNIVSDEIITEEIKEKEQQINGLKEEISQEEFKLKRIRIDLLKENVSLGPVRIECLEIDNNVTGQGLGLQKDNCFYSMTYAAALRNLESKKIQRNYYLKELENKSAKRKSKGSTSESGIPNNKNKKAEKKVENEQIAISRMENNLITFTERINEKKSSLLEVINNNEIKRKEFDEYTVVVGRKKNLNLLKIKELEDSRDAEINRIKNENLEKYSSKGNLKFRLLDNRFSCLEKLKDDEIITVLKNSKCIFGNETTSNLKKQNRGRREEGVRGKAEKEEREEWSNSDYVKTKSHSKSKNKGKNGKGEGKRKEGAEDLKVKPNKIDLTSIPKVFKINRAKNKNLNCVKEDYCFKKEPLLNLDILISEALKIKRDLIKLSGSLKDNEYVTYPLFKSKFKWKTESSPRTNRCLKRLILFLFNLVGVDIERFTYSSLKKVEKPNKNPQLFNDSDDRKQTLNIISKRIFDCFNNEIKSMILETGRLSLSQFKKDFKIYRMAEFETGVLNKNANSSKIEEEHFGFNPDSVVESELENPFGNDFFDNDFFGMDF